MRTWKDILSELEKITDTEIDEDSGRHYSILNDREITQLVAALALEVLLDIRQILANMQAEENKDGDSNRT